MSEIPDEILEFARLIYSLHKNDVSPQRIIAEQVWLERQRCADAARRYLEDIAGCDMNDDEPDKIAAAIMDPKWGPPPL